MSDLVVAIVVAALGCGVGALLVPRLIASVPEPTPKEPKEGTAPEPPKLLYVDIAALPGLGPRSALWAALSGGLLGWATGVDWSLIWLVPLVPVAARATDPAAAVAVPAAVALSVIDWHTRLLPRRIVLTATLTAVVAVALVGLLTDQREALVRALIAMIGVRSLFWLLWFLRSAGMGFGDVRLAALVGLVLGWVGWGAVFVGVWVGFVVFAVPGLALALLKRDRSMLKKPFPFGPFMVLGALFGLVWGPRIAAALWG